MEQTRERKLSRRDLLAAGVASGLALGGPASAQTASRKGRRTLRIAHLTDVHVQPEGDAPSGMAACLQHVHGLKDRPDVIFNGGDMIMDAMGADWERTQRQWDVWGRTLRDHCTLPIVHCLGNHDVWGWNRKRSGATGSEPLYGKKAALEQLGLERQYYGRDLHGWRLIVLDSTHPVQGDGYTARLDDEQMEWLAGELAATPRTTPVMILSHIPILCACAFLDGENEKTGRWEVPGAWMHIDARRLKDLFVKHPNVRLCLSGHIHLRDRVEYNGVTYLCNGAVCGAWWKGNYQETPPGYALIDLYDDGAINCQYVTYR